MSVKQIIEGWKNHLLPEEKKIAFLNELSAERMNICNACPECSINKEHNKLRPDVHCTNCGCTLAAKTKCTTCKCPLDKWDAVNEPNYE